MGQDHSGDSGGKPVDARVARRRQDAIGRRLRQMYDDVVSEPLPSEFLSILEDVDDGGPGGRDAKKKELEASEQIEATPKGRIAKSES